MGARQRQSAERSPSSESQMTHARFLELFPDNDACVEYLRLRYFPDGSACSACGKTTKFHRIRSRAAYSCQFCGHQVYPTAGTIFHKSSTSLQLWFWAIYLMSSTRCGISAKQLEREIGVTYPTALRMFRQIRTLLHEDDQLSGEIEADETYVGGRRKGRGGRPGASDKGKKTPVFGMVQRGGPVVALTVENAKAVTLMPNMTKYVLPESTVFTDEWTGYRDVERSGYVHHRINHSEGVYVVGNAHTNTIEGFWGLVKNGIRGVNHSVSAKHLQGYLDEYAFRFNRRDGRDPIFWAILNRVRNDGPAVV